MKCDFAEKETSDVQKIVAFISSAGMVVSASNAVMCVARSVDFPTVLHSSKERSCLHSLGSVSHASTVQWLSLLQ